MSRVVIVGSGYVGLVTGACLAALGHRVTCVDRSRDIVDQIDAGISPIHEDGLGELLAGVRGRQLDATTDTSAAVSAADVVVLAVGTPTGDHGIDLDALRRAVREVGGALDTARRPVVIVKSTVVPGTTEGVILPLLEKALGCREGEEFGVAVNPEFLTEGTAVDDFMKPDRIVVGARHGWVSDRVLGLYASVDERARRIVTTPGTAEMIKYASNALLATLISFSNEIANLAEAVGGVDIVDVMEGVHTSRYLTSLLPDGTIEAEITGFLEAGCGFGGSCLPKDVSALVAHGRSLGIPMRILESVLHVNDGRAAALVERAASAIGELEGKKIGVLGLAFKPGTDDMRNSPAIPIIELLLERGARVVAHDPVALPRARERLTGLDVDLCEDLGDLVRMVDAVILVTRWSEYLELPRLVSDLSPSPVVVDGRGVLEPGDIQRYVGIGR